MSSAPFAGYVRVSRVGDRSGESYISPDVQRAAIERWSETSHNAVVIFEPEENQSGGTMDRPIFNRILASIRRGEYRGIVVWKLDRFSRTMLGGLTALEELKSYNASFASATEPAFDFTTPMGEFFLGMNLSLAQYFRSLAREGWNTALTTAVGRGVHISPTVPYGYDKDESKRLVPNDAARYVVEAFAMRAEGKSWRQIADWLNANASARPDGRLWVDKTVQRMVQRRVYLGLAHWGAEENPDAHQALVDAALWDRANRKVSFHPRVAQTEDVALLGGIVRCAGCRFKLSRAKHKNTAGRKPYERYYYRCRKVRVSGVCTCPAMIRADGDDGIDSYVESIVQAVLDRQGGSYVSVEDNAQFEAALRALEDANEERAAYLADTSLRRIVKDDAYLAGAAVRQQAVEEAHAHVDELRGAQAPMLSGVTGDDFRNADKERKAEMIGDLIDVVFVRQHGTNRGPQANPVDERRVHILWRGEGPHDLPASNKATAVAPWPWPS
jgi:DNA invertase Pin-like site-specific DNA recombinase